jgi:hypothetical protein
VRILERSAPINLTNWCHFPSQLPKATWLAITELLHPQADSVERSCLTLNQAARSEWWR